MLERRDDSILTRWKTLVEEAPIEWTGEDGSTTHAPVSNTNSPRATSTSLKETWIVDDTGDGTTRVVLSVEYDFGVPTLAELRLGPTLQRKVQENHEMMLAGLKREGGSSGLKDARVDATLAVAPRPGSFRARRRARRQRADVR